MPSAGSKRSARRPPVGGLQWGRVALFVAGVLVTSAPFACGDLGQPAFEGVDGSVEIDGAVQPQDAGEDGALARNVSLSGKVFDKATGAPVPSALVAIELGGLDQPNPASIGADGSTVPTLKINPYYQLGSMTDDAGAFALKVPDEKIGVHVYARGYRCGEAVSPAGGHAVVVKLEPVPDADGAPPESAPVIGYFSVYPQIVFPGQLMTMSAYVQATAGDPLSQQVLAIEPTSEWSGVFAPPTPGTQGVGYPNGTYARLTSPPAEPGLYTYYLVAATEACAVSVSGPVPVALTVTGDASLPDEGVDVTLDAPGDGPAADAQVDSGPDGGG